ncbi:hypothetical protein [Geodermatophilus sp. SYSU D00684]
MAHEAALLRTAYLLTGARGHAEDLVQTAPVGCTGTFTHPVLEGQRSDVELAQVHAGWTATLADCTERAVGEG